MAYIVASSGCCHCKDCWDGFERHAIQAGFATKAAAEAAFKKENS